MFYLKDLGSSLLFFSLFLVMVYVATARIVYVLSVVSCSPLARPSATPCSPTSRCACRRGWIRSIPDFIQDEAYQLLSHLFAFATGGLFGTGWGQGRPDIIPAAHTDFIFAVIGEELGLMGTAAVIVTFLLLVARGFRVALELPERLRATLVMRVDRHLRHPDVHHSRRGN